MKTKKCKACGGRGFVSSPGPVITGKTIRVMGFEMLDVRDGRLMHTCGRCYGKGYKS